MASSRSTTTRYPPARSRRAPLWIGLGVVVAAAAITLGVAAAGGGDETRGSSSEASAAPVVVAEVAPVTANGAPLVITPPTGSDPAVGATAPTLEGTSFDGSAVSIGPDGSPTLVAFLAHWCPHCRAEVPLLSEWIRAGEVPEGLDVVAVSTSVEEQAPNYPPSAWLAREGWPAPVLVDDAEGTAGRAYGLSEFPYFVLLDGDGTVVDRFSGEIAPAALSARVTSALAAA